MRRNVILICLMLLLPPLAGQAQEIDPRASRAEIIRLLGQMHEFAQIRQEMHDLGFRGEKLDLAVAQYRRIYSDPTIAGYIADRVIEVYQAPAPLTEAGGLLHSLIDRGLGHLPTRDLLYYYKVERAMLGALPPRLCGRAIRGVLPLSRFADETSRAAARLSAPSLEQYYRVQFKAARLGVRGKLVRLDDAGRKRTETRINERLHEKIVSAPDTPTLLRAISNLRQADNASACRLGKMMFDSVLELEGTALREALIYMGSP